MLSGRLLVSHHPAARDQKQSLASAPPVPGGELCSPKHLPMITCEVSSPGIVCGSKGGLMPTRRITGFLLISILLATPALAQNKKTMSVIDLLNVPNLTAPQLSSDGNQIVFVLAKPDWKSGKR